MSIAAPNVLPNRGKKGEKKMNEAELKILEALQFMAPSRFYDYLRLQPEELIVSIVGLASNWCCKPTDSRSKLNSEFIVVAAIKEAREHFQRKPGYVESKIEKMLRVSARLLRKEIGYLMGSKISRGKIVSYALQVFGLAHIYEDEKGLFFGLLRDCGKSLSMKEVRWLLDNPDVWTEDKDNLLVARNLICAGYIEYNGAEKAFVALENDPLLSSVHMRTPEEETIESLKIALVAFNVNDTPSVDRAMAIFFSAREFLGGGKAMAIVEDVRPDLVGVIVESGKTFGKKAE